MTNGEARFNIALRPQKPEGSLGRGAQDGHLDFHTTHELRLDEGIGFQLLAPPRITFPLGAYGDKKTALAVN